MSRAGAAARGRRGMLGGPALAVLVALGSAPLAACGARDDVELVYPSRPDADGPAARVVMTLDYTRPLAAPDNFVLRPDEFGGAAVDAESGTVYVGTRDGYLFALEAGQGQVRWELPVAGAVASVPVLVRAPEQPPLLLVGTDNGVLHAIGADDREIRWSYETPGRVRNPPLSYEGVVFFVNSRDQIYALDLRTGEWRWQYEQELQTDFTVHGHAGLTFVPSVEQGGELGTLYTCFDNGKVVALAAGSGQSLWISTVAPPEGGDFVDCDSTPLVDPEQGLVFVSGQSTGVFALSMADGEPRWRFPMNAARSLVFAPDGALVGASSLEGVFVLERDGARLRWRSRTDPGVLSTPVVIGQTVFVTHSELGLLAFDLDTGTLQAQLRTGSGMASVPTYDPVRERLYAMTNRGAFVALRVGAAVGPDAAAFIWR